MSKIITIEGTDCSGKETQTKLLVEKLKKDGYKVKYFSFPIYDSPTGKIVGGSYLGKEEIGDCIFLEGATNVDALVASLYYTADRRYNYINTIKKEIEENDFVILDRYVSSNLAHQGGKIKDDKEREKFYKKIDTLEYEICELPRVDITIFLHMPYEASCLLKENREKLDEHEKNKDHLIHAEKVYVELSKKYNWEVINCISKEKFKNKEDIKTINEISEEVYSIVNHL